MAPDQRGSSGDRCQDSFTAEETKVLVQEVQLQHEQVLKPNNQPLQKAFL